MELIKEINIKSLKSIAELNVKLSNLNLFVGMNSAGKSTILQALLLLAQNSINNTQGLDGAVVSLGDFREVRNFNVTSDKIEIKATDFNNKNISLVFEETDFQCKTTVTCSDESLCNTFDFTKQNFHFLSSQRIGYQDVYKKNISNIDNFGFMGEYAIDFLLKNGSLELEKNMIRNYDDYTLISQVNYWLKYIVNANIKVEDIKSTDIIKASYEMIDNKNIRPKNVGSGISYLVSILIVCLASKPNDLILIENPEIHLHPTSQSKICEFLYFVSNCSRQIFIETHSDHIFNGVRAGIAEKSFSKDKITINFINLNSENCTENSVISVGDHGEILNNVPELFNQFDNDLDRMLGI